MSKVIEEVVAGDGLTTAQVAGLFPAHRGTRGASYTSVTRWIVSGTVTRTGEVVKLEAARVGGRWLSSRGAVARYMARLTEIETAPPVGSAPDPNVEEYRK